MSIQKRRSTLSDSKSEAEKAELEAIKKQMMVATPAANVIETVQKEKAPSLAKIRTAQINTHYKVKEKRRIEDAIRDIEDHGIKVSTESFVHNAVAWWFRTFGENIPYEQFTDEWKQNFEN